MSADLGSPIMLIRHAEKPQPGEQGVGLDGRPDERGLAVKGWARAGALVGLFAPDARLPLPGLARPGRLVAASCGDRRRSSRPRDTLALLAAALDLPIELYDDDKASLRAGRIAVAQPVRSVGELAPRQLAHAGERASATDRWRACALAW
jgi:hypothetical protein